MRRMNWRAARVADADHGVPPSKKPEVRAGHVPLRVGDEGERFMVRTELLRRPIFLELLDRSAQEYGYGQVGPIRIPCSVHLFHRLLDSAAQEQAAATARLAAEHNPNLRV